MTVKYARSNCGGLYGLCHDCFWYDEQKNQCDLYAPIEEIGENDDLEKNDE